MYLRQQICHFNGHYPSEPGEQVALTYSLHWSLCIFLAQSKT